MIWIFENGLGALRPNIEREERNRRRSYSRYASRLTKRLRLDPGELLAYLTEQTTDPGIIDRLRQARMLQSLKPLDNGVLAFNVTLIL